MKRRLPTPMLAAGAMLCALALAPGCGGDTTVTLALSEHTLRLLDDDPEQRAELERQLARLFGTPGAEAFASDVGDLDFDPNEPAIGQFPAALDGALVTDNQRRFNKSLAKVRDAEAALPRLPKALAPLYVHYDQIEAQGDDAGSARSQLATSIEQFHPTIAQSLPSYHRNCLTCHGREGGGNGPSALHLDPKPRDFRSGEFVHHPGASLGTRKLPQHADMLRVLHDGIAGTGMPMFRRLSTAELSGLVDVVRWLSVRGAVEREMASALATGGELDDARADAIYVATLRAWRADNATDHDN